MDKPTSFTRDIADRPDWMDEEDRAEREDLLFLMLSEFNRTGCAPRPVVELLAQYVEGELDDDGFLAATRKLATHHLH